MFILFASLTGMENGSGTRYSNGHEESRGDDNEITADEAEYPVLLDNNRMPDNNRTTNDDE